MPDPLRTRRKHPRPPALLAGMADCAAGRIDRAAVEALMDNAVRDIVAQFERLGTLAPDDAVICFADGHSRRLPGSPRTRSATRSSRHSLDADDAVLLSSVFFIQPGAFYLIGVTGSINPAIETLEQVRDRVMLPAQYIPPDRRGTRDDGGFSPFDGDASTSRSTARAEIRARLGGTQFASDLLGV